MSVQGKHHKGHKHHEDAKGKWRNKVKKISELLTVMDKMQAPGGLPFVSAPDISACEDLLEAYFMQVSLAADSPITNHPWSSSTHIHIHCMHSVYAVYSWCCSIYMYKHIC